MQSPGLNEAASRAGLERLLAVRHQRADETRAGKPRTWQLSPYRVSTNATETRRRPSGYCDNWPDYRHQRAESPPLTPIECPLVRSTCGICEDGLEALLLSHRLTNVNTRFHLLSLCAGKSCRLYSGFGRFFVHASSVRPAKCGTFPLNRSGKR